MSEPANTNLASAMKAVCEIVGGRGKKALFATELAAALRRANVGPEEMELALTELQSRGAVLVRDNFCADPHLTEVDLRVVAALDPAAGGADGHAAALAEIELAWNQWLGEYLANHRCG